MGGGGSSGMVIWWMMSIKRRERTYGTILQWRAPPFISVRVGIGEEDGGLYKNSEGRPRAPQL